MIPSMETEMLGIASQSLEEYDISGKSLQAMEEHKIVQECWRCEDTLAKGLKAYRIISSVDDLLRNGAEQGKLDLTHEIQDAILLMFQSWLAPSEDVKKWIAVLTAKEQRPKNAGDILIAIHEVETLLEYRKSRRKKINSVDNAKLREHAKVNCPPDQWFNGEDGY